MSDVRFLTGNIADERAVGGDLKDKQAKLAELSKELGDQKMYDALNEHVYAQLAEQEATRALSRM